MKYYINGKERTDIKKMRPRKIQEEAIKRITAAIKVNGKILINMPCRTGKTFTTIYTAYKNGIELLIVLCGKKSAKASYITDSVWINEDTGEVEGFNKVFTENNSVKDILKNLDTVVPGDRVLFEITPQLLNKNPDLVSKLADFTKTRKTLFGFDEAHFTERTDKTKKIVSGITCEDITKIEVIQEPVKQEDEADERAVDQEMMNNNFNRIPWVYLTASPDTESLHNVFLKNDEKHFYALGAEYYELTKEKEWDLYQEDLKLPVAQREFDYVPVRNCLYVMDKILNSIFDALKTQKQDYTSLFTLPLARNAAKKFIVETITKSIETIKHGPEKDFMADEDVKDYIQRGSNINLMIKVPQNSKKTNKSDKSVAEIITSYIKAVQDEILAAFPEYSGINILDVTLANNIGQDRANEFFDGYYYKNGEKVQSVEFAGHDKAINIILTQQRLIEGCTLYNLDAFLYYCTVGSLVKYKQESGRTLTPSAGKRFGFIFFFDEDALSLIEQIRFSKSNIKKRENGTKTLTEETAKRMTRVNPAFILDGNNILKLVDYSKSLITKTDLNNARIRNAFFDKDRLLAIPGLKDFILNLLKLVRSGKNKGTGKGSGNGGGHGHKKDKEKTTVDANTPNDKIELEKLVDELVKLYQDCIQNEVEVKTEVPTGDFLVFSDMHSIIPEAVQIMYEDDYAHAELMRLYDIVNSDQGTINPEEEQHDRI